MKDAFVRICVLSFLPNGPFREAASGKSLKLHGFMGDKLGQGMAGPQHRCELTKVWFASSIGLLGNLLNMLILAWGLRLCISYKLPGYASSACLVTMILCSKVLEDPGLKKKKKVPPLAEVPFSIQYCAIYYYSLRICHLITQITMWNNTKRAHTYNGTVKALN